MDEIHKMTTMPKRGDTIAELDIARLSFLSGER